MGRKDEKLIAQEKAEAAEKHTARFGKTLGSMPESEEERRQQALAMLRKKAQAKKAGHSLVDGANKQPKDEGKRVVDVGNKTSKEDGKRLASDERVLDDAYKKAKKDGKRVAVGDDKNTPSKKARAPRSHSVGPLVLEKNTKKDAEKPTPPTKIRIKAPNPKTLAPPPLEPVDATVEEASSPNGNVAEQETFEKLGFNPHRDRQKKPTQVELLEQLRQGVSWPPTRFADVRLMRELEIDQDMKDLLALMNMDSFYSMAHPTYKEVSCQFMASLEVTFHSSLHEEQGWGRISFKIDGKPYFMTFTEIGEVLGLKDLKESSLPKLKGLPKGKTLAHFTYKFLSGKDRVSSRDKNASIRHPSVRYLHRLIVHTIYPRKEPSNGMEKT
ncbi:hypothetical protein Bca52824_035271 [Brassica carinata]|uniref:Arabidopsis retrotransposon Orf1 C-terminal domain-containing protein n=1 Tax=Brassica carinata TaxID=52824 RepID=A0A8X7V1J9_BRACI|nr:hypothetical protein Bca52824_035271 [Brassica carinata]